jgi:hypothetical protein
MQSKDITYCEIKKLLYKHGVVFPTHEAYERFIKDLAKLLRI